MKVHNVKILSEYYKKVISGEKKFEIRKDDRDYQVNDILHLMEFDGNELTGESSNYLITYKLDGGNYGLENGYCILSIERTL